MKTYIKIMAVCICLTFVGFIGGMCIGGNKVHYRIADAERVMNICAETIEPTKEDYRIYDLNHNGKITVADASIILKDIQEQNLKGDINNGNTNT